MWIEIPESSQTRIGTSSTVARYRSFLAPIQREAREGSGSVVLIECKNEYDAGRPASAYEVAYLLEIPTALTVSIEGHGIFPFLHALFIAYFHLQANVTSVIIVASPTSKVPIESSGGNVKESQIVNDLRIVRLSLQQPEGDSGSLRVIALSVGSKSVSGNLSRLEDGNDLVFQSMPITADSAWLLDQGGGMELELLSHQPIESHKLQIFHCDSCFELLKTMPAAIDSAETMGKRLLLVQ